MNLGYEERAVPHRYRQFKFEGQNAFDSDESEPWCACVQVSPTGIGKLLKIIRIRLNSRSVIAFRLYCVVKRMPLWVFRHQRKRSTVFAFPSVEVWIAPDLKKEAPDAISDQNNPEIREAPERSQNEAILD